MRVEVVGLDEHVDVLRAVRDLRGMVDVVQDERHVMRRLEFRPAVGGFVDLGSK